MAITLLLCNTMQGQINWNSNLGNTTTSDKVGIGTTAPAAQAEVRGTALNLPNTILGELNKKIWFINNTTGPDFQTGIAPNLLISPSGMPIISKTSDQLIVWSDGMDNVNTKQICWPYSTEPGLGNPQPVCSTMNGNSLGGLVIAPLGGSGGIRIDKDGRVGIAHSTPIYPLHVNGTAKFDNNILANDIYSSNGLNGWDVTARNQLSVANRLYIGSIPNPSPVTYAMEVAGNIRTKGITVASGWCDYVFEPEYKLMPLDSLEQYVNANKHLPNIPSASKIETEGLNVGDIQKLQMEKIEELTLYIIALKKEISGLSEEIKKIK